jgi:hypothetical protein
MSDKLQFVLAMNREFLLPANDELSWATAQSWDRGSFRPFL